MINIVLYQPEKPSNTGNIMRTCMAIGAHLHIIGPISFSLNEKDFKRAGMDYITSVHYEMYDSLESFYKANPDCDIFYISRYGDKVYSNADFSDDSRNIFIMFGRESSGIPHDVLRNNRERTLRLPMVPEARSLNLSNCVAIVAYEVLRQQKFPSLATSEVIKGENFLENELKKS